MAKSPASFPKSREHIAPNRLHNVAGIELGPKRGGSCRRTALRKKGSYSRNAWTAAASSPLHNLSKKSAKGSVVMTHRRERIKDNAKYRGPCPIAGWVADLVAEVVCERFRRTRPRPKPRRSRGSNPSRHRFRPRVSPTAPGHSKIEPPQLLMPVDRTTRGCPGGQRPGAANSVTCPGSSPPVGNLLPKPPGGGLGVVFQTGAQPSPPELTPRWKDPHARKVLNKGQGSTE